MVDDRAEGLDKKVSGSIKETIGKVTDNGAPSLRKGQSATMAAGLSENRPGTVDSATRPIEAAEQRLTLYGEKIEVSRRRIEKAVVRATATTHSREQLVEAELNHERVEVERIPVGRTVDSVPPVRQEGDTTILSVVEEVVVVERRLVLKEEVHIRRVKTVEHHRETVTLREQEATISRTALEAGASAAASTSDDLRSNPLSNKDLTP